MKRTFILFLGVGWCGTTSVYYTLQKNLQYVHGGFRKEHHHLKLYYDHISNPLAKKFYTEINYNLFVMISQKLLSGHYDEDPVLSKFSESQLFSFLGVNTSLENYLNYYLTLDKYCEDKYLAVGDFSNTNSDLEQKEMEEINCLLRDYFDVKVLCIFRDPIRRLWSKKCAFSLSNTNSMFVHDIKKCGKQVIPPSFTFKPIVDVVRNVPCFDYTEKVSIAYDVFGKENVCYLIMEDFFKEQSNNSEVNKLEKFLNIQIPLDKIHPCCFVPDLGINSPRISNLPDQWSSDHEKLPPEIYQELRNREDYVRYYSKFENFHGSLPADWGHPIDYGY